MRKPLISMLGVAFWAFIVLGALRCSGDLPKSEVVKVDQSLDICQFNCARPGQCQICALTCYPNGGCGTPFCQDVPAGGHTGCVASPTSCDSTGGSPC